MKTTESQPHLDAIREKLLPLVLKNAEFDGWTEAVLARAGNDAGLHPGQIELALPRGCVDLIRYWAGYNDQIMIQVWEAQDRKAMRIRDKAVLLVRSRIEAIGEENREAASRALARMALPDCLGESIALSWRTSDTMWRAMNDQSMDFNYYSKRTILAAVFASTFAVWLQGDDDKTWVFLDRRIGNVMQFEGWKVKMRKSSANWPNPEKMLSRLRYGRGRSRPRRM